MFEETLFTTAKKVEVVTSCAVELGSAGFIAGDESTPHRPLFEFGIVSYPLNGLDQKRAQVSYMMTLANILGSPWNCCITMGFSCEKCFEKKIHLLKVSSYISG